MKIISDSSIFILLIIYWTVTVISWWGLKISVKNCQRPRLRFFTGIWIITGILQSFLIYFIYSFHRDQAGKYFYFIYTWFNAFLITDMVSKFPLLIAALLMMFCSKPGFRKVAIRMGIILSAGIFLTFMYGIFIGARSFQKQVVTLYFRNLPPAFDGFRIVQLSDVHLGSFHDRKMIREMAGVSGKFNPDVLCLTGDLVNNFAGEAAGWSSEFGLFRAACGKYAILGNHDYGDYTQWLSPPLKKENLRAIESAFSDLGFRLLRNESDKIVKGNDSIFIIGLENWGHLPSLRYTDLKKASAELPDSSFRVLLSHNPDYWESCIRKDGKYPLTLSGHTHGFQWGIRLAGIPFCPIWPLEHHWGGLYRYEDQYMYVNRGLGMIGMHFRIDMPAEITLITFRRSQN